jgi:hypothetical protein
MNGEKTNTIPFDEQQRGQVQRLALSGYDYDCSATLILEVLKAGHAREFFGALVREGTVTFGKRDCHRPQDDEDQRECAVSVALTSRGLRALELPDCFLRELQNKAPAFSVGAHARAAQHLGDSGKSAVERWDPVFGCERAHILLIVHGPTLASIEARVAQLHAMPGASKGLGGWDWDQALKGRHLTTNPRERKVHFGFVDNVARPRVDDEQPDPPRLRHRAGELVLGYVNDAHFNRWDDGCTGEDIVGFFRNGSFAALRMIEQNEEDFENTVQTQAHDARMTVDKLKAKLCGRWPDGSRILPDDRQNAAASDLKAQEFDFSDDPDGFGCPFGAHIRRTNPRGDHIAPSRLRPLFRRGMPYGPAYAEDPKARRGLMGLFFCASIEDQFEHLISEWIEKKPMGPRNFGDVKDPLVGRHDDDGTYFHIPQPNGPGIRVTGFAPFVTTRGTLYAFFPSRRALQEIVTLRSA